jgi:hypothetical protein
MYEENDYAFARVCRAFVNIADATDAHEVAKAFGEGMVALQDITLKAYERIGQARAGAAFRETHDDAVRAEGGE